MSTERTGESDLTQPIRRPDGDSGRNQDPLEKITITPRRFAAVLAVAAVLVGLVLALVPVHVAGPDPVNPESVTCGNTLGGVETRLVDGDLPELADRATTVSYIDMCDRAVRLRAFPSWVLFFGGVLGILWLGVVRRR